MLFKDVKQNYSLFILNSEDMSVKIGKVISVGFPRLESTAGNMSNTRMVIDFSVDIEGKTASYVIPENLAVTYAGSLTISPDKEIIIHEVEAMKSQAEQAVAAIDRQKEVITKATELLTELNPQFRERRETEERFGKIEESIDDLKGMFGDFLRKFNEDGGYRK